MMAPDATGVMKVPVRIDLAGGFTDNVAYLRDIPSYLSSISIAPFVCSRDGDPGSHCYVNGSGLAVSTALTCLEWASKPDGRRRLAEASLDEIANAVWDYENTKYGIQVGKGDAYPIVFGGFNCWQCQGRRIQRVDFDISRDTLDRLEKNILLLYSGVPRESPESLDQFNRNFDTGRREYLEAFEILKTTAFECGKQLAAGNPDAVGTILALNWRAQKTIAPAVSNAYLDAIYDCAERSGALGGKLSGAGGGGYFVFYSRDRDSLAAEIVTRFPLTEPQPFRFVYANIKELNRHGRP